MGHEVERSIELESFDDVQAEQLAGERPWDDVADPLFPGRQEGSDSAAYATQRHFARFC